MEPQWQPGGQKTSREDRHPADWIVKKPWTRDSHGVLLGRQRNRRPQDCSTLSAIGKTAMDDNRECWQQSAPEGNSRMTEGQLQAAIIHLAELMCWRIYHVTNVHKKPSQPYQRGLPRPSHGPGPAHRLRRAERRDLKPRIGRSKPSGPGQSKRRMPSTTSGARPIGCQAGWMKFSRGNLKRRDRND